MTEKLATLYAPLCRSVPVAEIAFDAGTLEALFVPWDRAVPVVEMTDEGVDKYEEGFRPGAFDRQLEMFPHSVQAVTLLPRHGSTETFGHARELTNTAAGLHGVVSVLPSRRDDVRTMIEDGVDSVSIEFHPLQRSPREERGVRWRSHAYLTGVAMTAVPNYPEARVLAMRDEADAQAAEARRRQDLDDLDDWLETERNRWA